MASESNIVTTCPLALTGPDEPEVIRPSVERWWIPVFLWLFALFWCGGSGAGFIGFLKAKEWFGVAFLGLFLFVGLLLVWGATYATLQIFNPKPTLVLSQRNVFCGSEFEVSWMFRGRTASISRMQIYLEGFEKVSYRQGTSTRTEESTFHRYCVIDTEDQTKIAKGFEIVSMPSDTMHSFKGSNNEIGWRFKLIGSVRYWPDIADEFPLVVRVPRENGDEHGGV